MKEPLLTPLHFQLQFTLVGFTNQEKVKKKKEKEKENILINSLDFISIYKKRYFRLYAEEKQLIYFQSDKDGLEKQLGVIDLSCISEPVRISSSIIQPSQSGLKKYQNFDIIVKEIFFFNFCSFF